MRTVRIRDDQFEQDKEAREEGSQNDRRSYGQRARRAQQNSEGRCEQAQGAGLLRDAPGFDEFDRREDDHATVSDRGTGRDAGRRRIVLGETIRPGFGLFAR